METAEQRAVAHIERRVALTADAARSSITTLLDRHGRAAHLVPLLVNALAKDARVTLNFHPDRLAPDGATVAEGLLRDGRYRSQFETGVTNGSPTAFAGGERDQWEEHLFGGAYHQHEATGTAGPERPKYGAYNVMSHADGGSPRFGSCYFELSPAVLKRCTFSWGDSYGGPEHVGTLDRFDAILAAWLEAVDFKGAALGVADLDVPGLVARLSSSARVRHEPTNLVPPGRALDDYIEAQVHGAISLARDVESLVIDPSFDGTPTGHHLVDIASRYGIALRRHAGFVLRPEEVPSDFRGPRMAPLAERISGGEELDAATIGEAARSLVREPTRWSDWGSPPETWQHLKQLWHVLVQFGRTAPSSR